jgi:hypothetical protein
MKSLLFLMIFGGWGSVAFPVQAAPLVDYLRLTEVMYCPIDGDPDFEYLEFHNISPTVTLDLSGCRMVQG